MKHTKNTEVVFSVLGTGTDENSKALVEGFSKMPEQAQGLVLSNMIWLNPDSDYWVREVITDCESPIEYVYGIALSLALGIRHDELWDNYRDETGCEVERGISVDIFPQLDIEADGKRYRADFVLAIGYLADEIPDSEIDQGIVVECDGFEYHHANKEQVQHDNERELAIKKAGYEVLRFSGSQIYNDPFKCANDTIDYIISEMNRRCVAEGTNG